MTIIIAFKLSSYFYSPRAYKFVAKLVTLPAVQNIRSWLGSIDCYPGFTEESVTKFGDNSGDPSNL